MTVLPRYVTVIVDSTFTIRVDDLWPDGDAPEPVTAEDVAALMHRSSLYAAAMLTDWNMYDLDVWVNVGDRRPVHVYDRGLAS